MDVLEHCNDGPCRGERLEQSAHGPEGLLCQDFGAAEAKHAGEALVDPLALVSIRGELDEFLACSLLTLGLA